MRIFKLASSFFKLFILFIPLYIFSFYSGFSYSHGDGSTLCGYSGCPSIPSGSYGLHPHSEPNITTGNYFSGYFYSAIPLEPDSCDSGFKPVTFSDGSFACVPDSFTPADIGLDMYGDGNDDFSINEDDDGNITVSSDDPNLNADNSGLNDYPLADSGGSLPSYQPQSDPDVTTTTTPPSTTTEGDITTTTEQITTTNNTDNSTTINTTETTTNNTTGDTTVTTTTTVVNGDTGEVTETQSSEEVTPEELSEGSVSGGQTCSAPLTRSGEVSDAEFNQILQIYYLRCPPDSDTDSKEYKPDGFDLDKVSEKVQQKQTEYTDLINEIKAEVNSVFSLSLSSGGSIQSNVKSFKGVDVDFSIARFASELSIIGALIIALAYLRAFFIVMKGE